jgi:DNA polymerase-3 subunit alpha
MGILVLPPDINESYAPFSVVPAHDGEEAKIRFGLTTIKNFGEGIAEEIVEERKINGPYTSVPDFLTRVTSKNLNKKSLEALIATGCFDRFEDRALLLFNIDTLLAFHKEASHGKASSQDSLFSAMGAVSHQSLVLSPVPHDFVEETLLSEKELLGVYVSGHPLDAYRSELEKRPSVKSIKLDGRNGIPVVTAGMIESTRELLTKKGDRMAFIMLSDTTDTIEMVAFPEVYQSYRELLIPGSCIDIKGRLSIRNDEPSVALERVKPLGTPGTPD